MEDIEVWNRILGVKQDCKLGVCCGHGNQDGKCVCKEYYEQFSISGVIIGCSLRGDGHLLEVTKILNGKIFIEKRRVPLPTGIRD